MAGVLSVDFSPNGYQLATGSEDNSARIWDLRKRSCLYTIPAHQSLVSSVRRHAWGGFITKCWTIAAQEDQMTVLFLFDCDWEVLTLLQLANP